jgi:hypothetical protein
MRVDFDWIIHAHTRYHNILFEQFRDDFVCPSCCNECNCSSCCRKKREPYISCCGIKIDEEIMVKLLSGEIRSLPPDLFARKGPKGGGGPKASKCREVTLIVEEVKTTSRPKRLATCRFVPEATYNEAEDVPTAQGSIVCGKPKEAVVQTQRML